MIHKFFAFLSEADTELLTSIAQRQSPEVATQMDSAHWEDLDDREKSKISNTVVNFLGDEFTDNLDESWEPTAYAKEVHSLLNKVNAERIIVNDRLRESYE